MVGQSTSREILNNTLLYVVKALKKYEIKEWFVGYGTLLGIVREGSCIDGDDDVDIVVNEKYLNDVRKLVENEGFPKTSIRKIVNSNIIVKTGSTNNLASVDFYMAQVNEQGDFYDKWEQVKWTKCYGDDMSGFVEKEWMGEIIYIPKNYETKLAGRYGPDWIIPKRTKGPIPKKKEL